MLNNDGFDSNLMLTHSDATDTNKESLEYQEGYRDGWWQQPEQQPESEDYMEGYRRGWNNRNLDAH